MSAQRGTLNGQPCTCYHAWQSWLSTLNQRLCDENSSASSIPGDNSPSTVSFSADASPLCVHILLRWERVPLSVLWSLTHVFIFQDIICTLTLFTARGSQKVGSRPCLHRVAVIKHISIKVWKSRSHQKIFLGKVSFYTVKLRGSGPAQQCSYPEFWNILFLHLLV